MVNIRMRETDETFNVDIGKSELTNDIIKQIKRLICEVAFSGESSFDYSTQNALQEVDRHDGVRELRPSRKVTTDTTVKKRVPPGAPKRRSGMYDFCLVCSECGKILTYKQVKRWMSNHRDIIIPGDDLNDPKYMHYCSAHCAGIAISRERFGQRNTSNDKRKWQPSKWHNTLTCSECGKYLSDMQAMRWVQTNCSHISPSQARYFNDIKHKHYCSRECAYRGMARR